MKHIVQRLSKIWACNERIDLTSGASWVTPVDIGLHAVCTVLKCSSNLRDATCHTAAIPLSGSVLQKHTLHSVCGGDRYTFLAGVLAKLVLYINLTCCGRV